MLRLKSVHCVQNNFELTADVAITAPITAVLGPSGAGKSTLLNVIAGFVPVQSGQVFWGDQDISNLPPNARPVSMIFQDNNLFPHLSVAENLALALPRDGASSGVDLAIEQVLQRVDLPGLQNRKPAPLSGGQQARVALARVLLQDRPLMLLDEAFASLGPALTREMLQLVRSVSTEKGMRVIMISHNPDEARLIADEGIVVTDGHVSLPMEIGTLLDNPPKGLAEYL